ETGEQGRLDSKNVRIITKADIPLQRSWPPPFSLIAFAAAVFGVSAGTGLALWRGPPGNHNPVPQSIAAPAPLAPEHRVLAMLPDMSAGHPLKLLEDPKSRPAAEIRRLHDALRNGRKKWSS